MGSATRFAYTDAGQLLSEDGPWAEDAVTYGYTARRRTVESWLRCQGLIAVRQNQNPKVSTTSPNTWSHN